MSKLQFKVLNNLPKFSELDGSEDWNPSLNLYFILKVIKVDEGD